MQKQIKKGALKEECLNNFISRSVYSAQTLTHKYERLSTSDFSAAAWVGKIAPVAQSVLKSVKLLS